MMKCDKCMKNIKNKEKNLIEISYYKEVSIDRNGNIDGGTTIKYEVYHKKCFKELFRGEK